MAQASSAAMTTKAAMPAPMPVRGRSMSAKTTPASPPAPMMIVNTISIGVKVPVRMRIPKTR